MIAVYEVRVIPAKQKSRYVHRQLTAGASRNGADQAHQRRCCSYCAAADCFLAFGFGDSRRVPFTATLLRFTYALRRFRLVLTRCCWPMRCSIDALRNRRNGQPDEHGNAGIPNNRIAFPSQMRLQQLLRIAPHDVSDYAEEFNRPFRRSLDAGSCIWRSQYSEAEIAQDERV
jgi:hypothetical protein